ncbi:hypothetical protein N8639_02110, partial [bacterium]|nr:hypothetical protein [bacterium]
PEKGQHKKAKNERKSKCQQMMQVELFLKISRNGSTPYNHKKCNDKWQQDGLQVIQAAANHPYRKNN